MTKNNSISSKTPQSLAFLIGLISIVLSAITHAYLTQRHFNLFFGHETGPSLCQINATFDCDVVAASKYSSLLGAPLALWGVITNLILFTKATFYRLSWDNQPNHNGHFIITLSGFIAFMSVIMGAVSITQLSVYCPFCIATYILSFITFFTFTRSIPTPTINQLKNELSGIFTTRKSHLISLAMIPAITWVSNGILHQQYKVPTKKLNKIVAHQISDWKGSKFFDFSNISGLELGASKENAKMTIFEFADFRCGHCKNAAPKLHAFTKANNDVRLVFIPYPLDGACNESIQRNNGISCRLAKASLCGTSFSDRWKIHDYIFNHQTTFTSLTNLDQQLIEMSDTIKINWENLKTCIETEETHNKVVNDAKFGDLVGVRGTPAIFVNGKFLNGGQTVHTLKEAYKTID